MNKEQCKEVLEFLKQLPDERFDYSVYLKVNGSNETSPVAYKLAKEKPPCGSAGCIAGHICILHWQEYIQTGMTQPVEWFAAQILGISPLDRERLFRSFLFQANRQDAILRMEHLIEHESMSTYDFTKESHKATCPDTDEDKLFCEGPSTSQ